jgi:hypothetical protein
MDRPGSGGGRQSRPGDRPVRRGRDGRVPAVPPAAAPGWAWASRTRGQLFPAGQPDHLKTGGPLRAGALHARQACAQVQDCALCHHYRPLDESASETTRCSACHQEPFKRTIRNGWGSRPPTTSSAWTATGDEQGPRRLHRLPPQERARPQAIWSNWRAKPEPSQVTSECLRCHKEAGEDMLNGPLALERPIALHHEAQKGGEHGKATIATQQLLSEHHQQRGSLHQLSRRLRMERQHLRFYRYDQDRLPGVPRHHRDL